MMNNVWSLTARSRAFAAGLSVACFAASIGLTPTEVRSQVATTWLTQTAAATPLAKLTVVAAVRDPFEPLFDDRISPVTDPTSKALPVPALGPLPPNAGAGPFPFRSDPAGGRALRVSAIVTGPHPSAVIEDDGIPVIVTVGSRIGKATVTSIAERRIHLSSGTMLPLVSPRSVAHE